MTITIVGLGPGDIDDLSRKAWRVLENAKTVYLRTNLHQCVPHLPQNPTYHSFDDIYNTNDAFETVYERIVEVLITQAKNGDVVYAVPGDPFVGESTPAKIMARAKSENIPVEIVSGISYIEPMLRLIGYDALDGIQLLDGLDLVAMHHPPINPDYPAIIGQVYSQMVASDIKLTLMNQYPDEFEVTLIHSAGTSDEIAEKMLLYAIDQSEHIGHTTSLYLPAMGEMSSFEQFQEIVAHLRSPEGCPWDIKQTHTSLIKYMLEEAYEAIEAIEDDNPDELAKELGDLLLQVVLHTQIAIDEGEFYMTDVLRHINTKMIRRHPHVWKPASGEVTVENADQVVTNWEAIKASEKADKSAEFESMLAGVPKGMPALMVATQYQDRMARVGFDWADPQGVVDKVREELAEVLEAQTENDPAHLMEEVGDLFFVLVNWARWMKIDPESALKKANEKVYRRFEFVEKRVAESHKPFTDYTLDELDKFWDEGKKLGL
ncbi:MAG: nucleoside triphosphate pyrophosphohydrolase [Phototrophicales bacterium]|nr:nucleoside triphosphate pyrophosphohydrolase [Phototrophicales bacterium]